MALSAPNSEKQWVYVSETVAGLVESVDLRFPEKFMKQNDRRVVKTGSGTRK